MDLSRSVPIGLDRYLDHGRVHFGIDDPLTERRLRDRWVTYRKQYVVYFTFFFITCCMYGLSAYVFVRYLYGIITLADGLFMVDKVMKQQGNEEGRIDWNFFGPAAIMTIGSELYAFTLTAFMMMRECDKVSKYAKKRPWNRLFTFLHFVVAMCFLGLLFVILYFSVGYHYFIVHKVLITSPNGSLAVEVFRNATASVPCYPFFDGQAGVLFL